MNAKLFTEDQKAALLEAVKGALSGDIKEFFQSAEKGNLTDEEIEKAGRFKMTVTTADFDRYGESIDLDSWDLSHYLKNPVVLWGHDYSKLPVGVTTSITKTKDGLVAEGYFAPEEANPDAQKIRRLYDAGLIRASSVGLIVHEREGNVIVKAELLEWSFVTVPANPHALTAAKDLGMDIAELLSRGILVKAEGEEEEEEAEGEEETAPDAPEEEEKSEDEPTVEEDEETQEDEPGESEEEAEGEEETEEEEKALEKGSVDSDKVNEILSRHMTALRQDIDERIVAHMNEIVAELGGATDDEKAARPTELEATHIDADLKGEDDPEVDQDADVKASEYGSPLTLSEEQMVRVLKGIATITNQALKNVNENKL